MSFAELLSAVDAVALASLSGSEVVTYRNGEGFTVTVRAIFESRYQLVTLGEAGVSSFAPSVFVRAEDLNSDPREDLEARIFVGARKFSIRETQPDGQGAILILLHEEFET